MITVLAGGTGGGRFLQGLAHMVPQEEITVITNTGDDAEFYDLYVSPDSDIVIYHLAGVADEERGWGYAGDTFHCLNGLGRFGHQTWFNLGDRDLATHIHRTLMLRRGHTLSEAIADIARAFGLGTRIIPMSDDPVRTKLVTPEGRLDFQEFWVQRGGAERVLAIEYQGAEEARPAPGVIDAILGAQGIIVAPSHPLFSIGTILAVPGVQEALHRAPARVVAISPIVSTIRFFPADERILEGLGLEVSPYQVAKLYQDFVDVMIIDTLDREQEPRIRALGLEVVVTNTIMRGRPERVALARDALTALGYQRGRA